jgi:exonuclease III
MPNYNVYHVPHPDDRAHGGAAVIIRSAVSHHELIHHQNKKFQAACVKVDLKPWSLTLSAVYCPPRHTISSAEYVELLESYGSKYLIEGDWNAKHSPRGARLITPKGRNLLEALNKQTCNYLYTGEPTYWPSDYNNPKSTRRFHLQRQTASR